MWFRRKLLPALMTIALLYAPGVRAEELPAADGEYRRASELAAGGRIGEAMKIWVEIVDKVSTGLQFEVHRELGLAYRKFGKLPEAFHHLSRYGKMAVEPDQAVMESLAQVEKSLSRKYARVDITSVPTGASFFPYGKGGDVFTTPVTWWFEAGSHTLGLVYEGYETSQQTIVAGEPGSTVIESVLLHENKRDGVLQVKGPEVGAQVFIDGKLEGTVPFQRKLQPGTYELMVGRPGLPVWKKQVTIAPEAVLVKRPRLPRLKQDAATGSLMPAVTDANAVERLPEVVVKPLPKKKGPPLWKWAVLGSGIAVLAVGGGLHGLAYSKHEDLKKKYPDGTYYDRVLIEDEAHYQDGYKHEVVPLATAGYVLYGIGGAALATGTMLVLLHSKAAPTSAKSSAWLVPDAIPGGGGLSFGTTF
jgi:hypothetical protein